MAGDILKEQRNVKQRSHAGFVGFQDVQFSYPYLDKRMLEFGLAVGGRFKHQDGCNRRLLRLGMEGLLPNEILKRTSKAPFSPDYHLRYQMDKSKAARTLKNYYAAGKLSSVVDFEKVMPALESRSVYRPENPMRVDYSAQFLIPFAMYLCYFLESFTSRD